jgi:hypothetical protein
VPRRVVLLKPEMLGHFVLQLGHDDGLVQLLEQPIRASQGHTPLLGHPTSSAAPCCSACFFAATSVCVAVISAPSCQPRRPACQAGTPFDAQSPVTANPVIVCQSLVQ